MTQQTTITVTTGEVIVHEDGSVTETRQTHEVPANQYLEGILAFLRAMSALEKGANHG